MGTADFLNELQWEVKFQQPIAMLEDSPVILLPSWHFTLSSTESVTLIYTLHF